ncbi:RluA family pseudouridine synthase [Paenibacillus sp. CFBP13512]|uniref:RluA family pseudouridine synthase n=1 Tax=Paenibacillus sp. CFBP13512 TaxID=2184007 RepID=UPI0010BFA0F6|nr:RluA family pseudouridine synthase [Paenibacillus sp. CFBP13512]TKJ92058.1 RluA family pseudouridine synthase [Paenibacillus sp. CFBP13512]
MQKNNSRSNSSSNRSKPTKSGHKGKPTAHASKAKSTSSRNGSYRSKPIPPTIYTVKEATELLPFLLDNLTNISRNSVKSILARGQVIINEKTVTAYNHMLRPGQEVMVHKEPPVAAPAMVGLSIMFEDEHLIVIHKDAGLLSIASDKEKDVTAYRQLTEHVRATDPEQRIFVVHRLDRDTSGVMMFAKSHDVQQQLQNTWRESVEERTYVALVEGEVKKPEGTISSWLKESKTLKMFSNSHDNGGQHAVTHFKRLQKTREYSLLEVRLETGRKNQIRVHMEDLGHPIVGDKKYGARAQGVGRLGLHARVLSFIHPVTGETMRFETDIPKSFKHPFKDAPESK